MTELNSDYQSYLLRIWKDSPEGDWHATLQDVFSSESRHYATLYELYVNLWEMTSEKIHNAQEQTQENRIKQFSNQGEAYE